MSTEQDRAVLCSILDYIRSERKSFYCRPSNHHKLLVENIESIIERHLNEHPTKYEDEDED